PRDVMPGVQWADAIVHAIEGSRLMVLVFSSETNGSQHIVREIEFAAQHRLLIVPFRVEEVVPSPTLDYYIAGTHWLDAVDPPLERHLERLATVVKGLLGDRLGEIPAPPAAIASDQLELQGRDGGGPGRVTALIAPPAPPPSPVMPGGPADGLARGRSARRRSSVLVGGVVVAALTVAVAAAIMVPGLIGDAVEAPGGDAATIPPALETPSASPDVSPTLEPVQAPTELRALYRTTDVVRLTWERSQGGARVEYFRVYRDGEPVGGRLTDRWYVDTDIRPGGTYRYIVVAVGADRSRARSRAVSVHVPAPPPPSVAPATQPPAPPPPAECDGIWIGDDCIPAN
ncbi:MAG: TIR domain-containing protein, partial [Actinomycetota bacterium]